MKIVYTIACVIGFLLIAGTAGSSDFYDECKAAADCVAGEPMSTTRMVLQMLAGLAFGMFGVSGLLSYDEEI